MSTDLGRPVSEPTLLAVSVCADGPVTRVALTGELDASTVTTFYDAVACAAQDPGAERVRADLARLTFIDSAGIRCLLECRSSVLAAGRQFEVADASAQVVDVLAITGLLTVFGLADRLPGTPAGLRPQGGGRRGPYQPKGHEQVAAESLTIRQAARQMRERAAAVHESAHLRLPGLTPPGAPQGPAPHSAPGSEPLRPA